MNMLYTIGAFFALALLNLSPGLFSAAAEAEGNPWWLWILVIIIVGAFVVFMLWWWLREEDEVEPARHAQTPPPSPAMPLEPVEVEDEALSDEIDAVLVEMEEEQAGEEIEPDDLKIVEGIGPRISGVLQAAGIKTFRQLAELDAERIEKILEEENPNLKRLADPTTWPEQARLAAEGRWEELETLQEELKGGRRA
jgi:predicted flap endonuclease-1-like 5' DNA nuclease